MTSQNEAQAIAINLLNELSPKVAQVPGLMLFAPQDGDMSTQWRFYCEDTTRNPIFGYFTFEPKELWHSYDVDDFGQEELSGGMALPFIEKHIRRAFEDLDPKWPAADCEILIEVLKLFYIPGQMVFNVFFVEKTLTRYKGMEDEGGLVLRIEGAFLIPRASVPSCTQYALDEENTPAEPPYLILPFRLEY